VYENALQKAQTQPFDYEFGSGARNVPTSAEQSLLDKFGNMSTQNKLLTGSLGLQALPVVSQLAGRLFGGSGSGVPERKPYDGPLSKFKYNKDAYTPLTTPQPTPYQPMYKTYAMGGLADLGDYSDGGRLLKGPGDGMSDSIPATINNKQPARLANDEFVVPADVVSHLGNGSSDAGAKQLYKMMDKIRAARTGTKKQGKQINPSKYLPA
jgi:hypothetical protein